MTPDARLVSKAQPTFGVFTSEQAYECGLSKRAVRHRIENGRFGVLHPGILTLAGVIPSWRAHLYAACVWSGGIASHRSAAAMLGLSGFEERGRPEVVVTSCHLPPRSGIIVHVTDRLPQTHRLMRDPIPVTSVERTLLDLGAVVSPRRVAIALDDAVLRGFTTLPQVDSCLRAIAKRGRRGCGVLRKLLEERQDLEELPNSALETIAFEIIVPAGYPMPTLQFSVIHEGRFVARPDFAWPERKLALEMDSYKHHGGRDAFDHDRDRLDDLLLAGWRVIHSTWTEATKYPERLLAKLAAAWKLTA